MSFNVFQMKAGDDLIHSSITKQKQCDRKTLVIWVIGLFLESPDVSEGEKKKGYDFGDKDFAQ